MQQRATGGIEPMVVAVRTQPLHMGLVFFIYISDEFPRFALTLIGHCLCRFFVRDELSFHNTDSSPKSFLLLRFDVLTLTLISGFSSTMFLTANIGSLVV